MTMVRNGAFDLVGLAFWLLLTFGVAALASQFEPGEWYMQLAKPGWTPPGWLFGPVWGMLYLSMGVAAWLVWRRRNELHVTVPLTLYVVQLAVNGLWSWLFFGRQWIGLALVDIVALAILIAATILLFWRVRRLAGLLLVPYLLWVSFATILNLQIWRLN